ncbi:reverse transcriptase-RNase H-integrase [Lentinula edodes]|uniref:Reverse transcriptase-RNase H-integrase n=1 Tax=Lentinula edodes TaxID=5353 RepID=A0A1Q3ENW3_LENED|nr:reverse transcriptase-RNase H-integrase [Lentinula edodes]
MFSFKSKSIENVNASLRKSGNRAREARKGLLTELKEVCTSIRPKFPPSSVSPDITTTDTIASIRTRIENLATLSTLRDHESRLKQKYHSIFEPIPHVDDLPTTVTAKIQLIDAAKSISSRSYRCPRKFRSAWQTLIQKHLDSGKIRPSDSPYASPSFVIPKSDPNALPRWVADYRQLNDNTVVDAHPLPRIDDILADCAKGRIWGKIDMTDSFFQTRMEEDSIKLTAITTPFGLYEWTVMPQGLKNSPAIHQRRVTSALRHLIGKICYVYVDDIIIWSKTIEEHIANVERVLLALRMARLYCNPNKCELFTLNVHFLGHSISSDGISADDKKVDRILDWPTPKTLKELQAFLGLVRYVAAFLPRLAELTDILTGLTSNCREKDHLPWESHHQTAFDAIKTLVSSRECLTVIDHDLLDSHKIFVTTDASDRCSGAVLSFGTTWESARPVSFDSSTFKNAELNYPVHEKELLAIIRALKKWRVDLLGVPFVIMTDHRTLENFHSQPDLSRRQARWMEFFSQFDCKIVYVAGERNTVADALSRRTDLLEPKDIQSRRHLDTSTEAIPTSRHPYAYCPDSDDDLDLPILCILPDSVWFGAQALAQCPFGEYSPPIATTIEITSDSSLLQTIRDGYSTDAWCKDLPSIASSMTSVRLDPSSKLWYIGNRLIIPRAGNIREELFRLAHDNLGHFGFDKSYASLRECYYWPHMRRDLEKSYVPACDECQRNKSSTQKKPGPLHPLPIPDRRFSSVAMDFIGPLPEDDGSNCILTITDRLGADIRIIPCRTDLTAAGCAQLFFDHWYCENGLPDDIVSDRDHLFVSKFWEALRTLSGVRLRMSTSYHPESDGSSERSNKTVIQMLRYHVERNQKGWKRALPRIRFEIMNTVNSSIGMSGFQLRSGFSPRLIPPLVPSLPATSSEHEFNAHEFLTNIQVDVLEAQDCLLSAKIDQLNDRVMLKTKHRKNEYKRKGEKRAAKFFPRYDGPYTITDVHPEFSAYTLDLPPTLDIFPTFHADQLKLYTDNDPTLFPNREFPRPGPIVSADGLLELEVDRILDERKVGRGRRYLVRWRGYGPEFDSWEPGRSLQECEALDIWEGIVEG